jgi:hypothetical protein
MWLTIRGRITRSYRQDLDSREPLRNHHPALDGLIPPRGIFGV